MIALQAIAKILEDKGGYKSRNPPLYVADSDLHFDIDAVLVGPDDRTGLVLLIDGAKTEESIALRKIRSLAIVLDRVGSRRSLSVVIVTEKTNHPALRTLETYCRVIVVHPSENIERAIRSLLPIKFPKPEEIRVSFEQVFKQELGELSGDPLVTKLIEASNHNSDTVENVLVAEFDAIAQKGNSTND